MTLIDTLLLSVPAMAVLTVCSPGQYAIKLLILVVLRER